MGNSLGRALLGGSDILRSRAVGTGFKDKFHQCDCSEKLCAQDLPKFPNPGPWDGQAGSETKIAQVLAQIFSGQIPSTRLSRKTGAKDFSNGV